MSAECGRCGLELYNCDCIYKDEERMLECVSSIKEKLNDLDDKLTNINENLTALNNVERMRWHGMEGVEK